MVYIRLTYLVIYNILEPREIVNDQKGLTLLQNSFNHHQKGSGPLTKFFHAIATQEKPQKNWVGQPRTISKKCVRAPGDGRKIIRMGVKGKNNLKFIMLYKRNWDNTVYGKRRGTRCVIEIT